MESQTIIALFKAHGIRPTQQRQAVYQYLMNHRSHPSADKIFVDLSEEYPSFSRTTVYNSLHTLVQAGLVLELTLDTQELHYDADVSLHGHFQCHGCGKIYDIPLDTAAANALRPLEYTVEEQEVYFSGLCPDCGKKLRS